MENSGLMLSMADFEPKKLQDPRFLTPEMTDEDIIWCGDFEGKKKETPKKLPVNPVLRQLADNMLNPVDNDAIPQLPTNFNIADFPSFFQGLVDKMVENISTDFGPSTSTAVLPPPPQPVDLFSELMKNLGAAAPQQLPPTPPTPLPFPNLFPSFLSPIQPTTTPMLPPPLFDLPTQLLLNQMMPPPNPIQDPQMNSCLMNMANTNPDWIQNVLTPSFIQNLNTLNQQLRQPGVNPDTIQYQLAVNARDLTKRVVAKTTNAPTKKGRKRKALVKDDDVFKVPFPPGTSKVPSVPIPNPLHDPILDDMAALEKFLTLGHLHNITMQFRAEPMFHIQPRPLLKKMLKELGKMCWQCCQHREQLMLLQRTNPDLAAQLGDATTATVDEILWEKNVVIKCLNAMAMSTETLNHRLTFRFILISLYSCCGDKKVQGYRTVVNLLNELKICRFS